MIAIGSDKIMNEDGSFYKLQRIDKSNFEKNNKKFLHGLSILGFGVHTSRSLMSSSALSMIQGNLLGPLGFSIMYVINFIPALLFIWLDTNYFSLNACIIFTIIGQICLSIAILSEILILAIIGEIIFGFAAFLVIIHQRTLISVYYSSPAFGLGLSVSIASFVKLASKIGISGIIFAGTTHNSSTRNSNHNEDDGNVSAFIISLSCMISCFIPLLFTITCEYNTSNSVGNNNDDKNINHNLHIEKASLLDSHELTTYNTIKQKSNSNHSETDEYFNKFNLSLYSSTLLLPIILHGVNIFLYHPIDSFIPHILLSKFEVTKFTMTSIKVVAPLVDMMFAPIVGCIEDHCNFESMYLIVINLAVFSIAQIIIICIYNEMDNINNNIHQGSVNFISFVIAYVTIALTRTFLTISVMSLMVVSMTAPFDTSLKPIIDIESVIIHEQENVIQEKKKAYQKGFIGMEIVSNFVNIVAYLTFGALYSESNGYTRSLLVLLTVSVITTVVLVLKLWRHST